MSIESFLLDTTVWIKYLRGLDETARDKVGSMVLEQRAYTTEIIMMEILRGAKSNKEYAMLHADFLALPRLHINREVWETAWAIGFKLQRGGANVPLVDTLVSAVALHYKCTLLHADKHFPLIAKHTGLKTLEL